jgi:hypothetical protein
MAIAEEGVAISVAAFSVVAVTVGVLLGSNLAPLGLRAHQRNLRDWSPRRLLS